MSKKILGYQYTVTMCRGCGLSRDASDFVPPLLEGDDYGVPFRCDYCDEPLIACEHEWGDWFASYDGGEIRFCGKNDCQLAEYR